MTYDYFLDEGALRLGDPGFQGITLMGGLKLNKTLLGAFINKARRLVSKKTLCYQLAGSVNTVATQNAYTFPTDLGGVITYDWEFIAVRLGDRSYITTSAGSILPLTGISWSEYLRLVGDSSGTPEGIFFNRKEGKAYIVPALSEAVTNGLTLVARCFVPWMDADNNPNTDGLPEEYQDLVFNKVLADLHPDAQVRREQLGLFLGGCREALRELAKERQPLDVPELYGQGIP